MKRLITSFMFIILFMVELTFPQTYKVTVQDQHTFGTDFIFDIYIMMNEPADFYLGGSDFSLHFNSNNFSNPVASVQNSEEVEFYTSAISILNSNVIVLNILPPFFSNQEEFESMSARISMIEPGTKIAEITISNISNYSGDAGLTWKGQTPNQCVIYSFNNSSPWFTTAKTSDGEFIPPAVTPLPVELSSFTSVVKENSVELQWTTEMEINNYGFEVERTSPLPPPYKGGGGEAGGGWQRIGFVDGSGNSNSQKQYSFTDKNIGSGNYSYRLKQIDNDGTYEFSKAVEVSFMKPNEFSLEQNYPNPFNPSTILNWQLAVSGQVTLKIFNALGEEVETLVNELKEAGYYSTLYIVHSTLPSGVYFYQLQSGSFAETKKMMFIK